MGCGTGEGGDSGACVNEDVNTIGIKPPRVEVEGSSIEPPACGRGSENDAVVPPDTGVLPDTAPPDAVVLPGAVAPPETVVPTAAPLAELVTPPKLTAGLVLLLLLLPI